MACVTVEGTGSCLVQTTGKAAVVREVSNKSATRPVEGPGTGVVIQQNTTQSVEAPGAGMATQPVEAPGAGPDVLLTGTSDAALQSDNNGDLHSEPGSPVDDNFRYGSPYKDLTRDEAADQELSEESCYRETIRGHLWTGIRFLNSIVFPPQPFCQFPSPANREGLCQVAGR